VICLCCGFSDEAAREPYRRLEPGEDRCKVQSCRVIGSASLFSKGGRCPHHERLWQAVRAKLKMRRIRGRNKRRGRRALIKLANFIRAPKRLRRRLRRSLSEKRRR
jgi:hypothetical protein